MITMHRGLHTRDDGDKLYVSRKVGGRGFASIADCVVVDYIKKSEERLIRAVRNSIGETRPDNKKKKKKKKKTETRKQKWEENMYGDLKRQTDEITHKNIVTKWLRNGNLKKKTGSFLIAAQNKAIKTNYIMAKTDNTQQFSKFRLCEEKMKQLIT